MAKPSVIEARKAAAMEDLAARLTAIESHLTGGSPDGGPSNADVLARLAAIESKLDAALARQPKSAAKD